MMWLKAGGREKFDVYTGSSWSRADASECTGEYEGVKRCKRQVAVWLVRYGESGVAVHSRSQGKQIGIITHMDSEPISSFMLEQERTVNGPLHFGTELFVDVKWVTSKSGDMEPTWDCWLAFSPQINATPEPYKATKTKAETDTKFEAGDTANAAWKEPAATPPDTHLKTIEWQGNVFGDWEPERDLLVVGESFHPQTFLRLSGGDKSVNGDREGRAFIVAEPDNKYDPNAVAVWIPEGQVGHIPRDAAAAWQKVALALRSRGQVLTVPCWVGWGPGPEHGDQRWTGSARLRWCNEAPTISDIDEFNESEIPDV